MIEVNTRHDVTQLVGYLNSMSDFRYFACFKEMVDRIPAMQVRIKHYSDLTIGLYQANMFNEEELDNIVIMCDIAGYLHDHIKEVCKCEKECKSNTAKSD